MLRLFLIFVRIAVEQSGVGCCPTKRDLAPSSGSGNSLEQSGLICRDGSASPLRKMDLPRFISELPSSTLFDLHPKGIFYARAFFLDTKKVLITNFDLSLLDVYYVFLGRLIFFIDSDCGASATKRKMQPRTVNIHSK